MGRRYKLASGAAFEGAAKRTAFAHDCGALHFPLVRRIVRALACVGPPLGRIVDLGRGTLAAGAAWALEEGGRPERLGVDRSGFAVREAGFARHALGPSFPAAAPVRSPRSPNEVAEEARRARLERLLEAASRGVRVLVVEPLGLRAIPWWRTWKERFVPAGGREDERRFRAELPGPLAVLHRAAGFASPELSARSLWLPGDHAAPRGPDDSGGPAAVSSGACSAP